MREDPLSIIAVAIVTFMGGATSGIAATVPATESVSQTISVSVYFLDAMGKPSPVDSIPRDLAIRLGAMPGSFGGRGDVPLKTIRVGRKKEFQLDLADLSAKLSVGAARFSGGDVAPLKPAPGGVKFSRVSTGALSGADGLIGLAVVFWDLEANGSLVPVYFDRRCQLRGVMSADAYTIDIPSPGLAWMLTTKDKNSRYALTLAVNPHPVIIIAPPEALDRISSATLESRN